jgi:hypothetical protein
MYLPQWKINNSRFMESLWSVDIGEVREREDLMTISVSGSLSTSPSVAEPVSAPSAVAQPSPKTAAPADADTVKLSQAAQVRLFKQQGQSLSQIATNLSIPMATVDGYLGIQVPTPNATPASAQPPAQSQGQAVASPPPAKG